MNKLNYFQNKPKAKRIDVDSYLKRIQQQREEPTIDYLRRLHRAHLLHIPFENLDIHYHSKIILDYDMIFNKVIQRKRGGYCYELNGLFFHLLQNLGFESRIISAQVKSEDSDEYGKDFDHMALIVYVDEGEFLVDVGFGKGIIYPKRISNGLVQMDYTNYYKITKDINDWYFLQASNDASSFNTKYKFLNQSKEMIQFHPMNEYHQSSQDSMFTQRKFITKLTETGRVTLSANKLIEHNLGTLKETPIGNEDEFLALLEQHFGITYHQLISNKG